MLGFKLHEAPDGYLYEEVSGLVLETDLHECDSYDKRFVRPKRARASIEISTTESLSLA